MDIRKEITFYKEKKKKKWEEKKNTLLITDRFSVAYFIKSKILHSHMTVQILCGLLGRD